MIFKDEEEREVLPIWLDTLEANLLLAQTQSKDTSTTAHKATFKIFRALKLVLKSLYFDDVAGSAQFATLELAQGERTFFVKLRAAEAMSLAMNAEVKFYTNRDVVEKSRAMTLEMLLHATDKPVSKSGREASDLH